MAQSIRDAAPDLDEEVRDPVPHIDSEAPEGVKRGAYPKRYWTAGPGTPQVKLVRTSARIGKDGRIVAKDRALKPRYYAYIIENKEEEDFLLRSAMRTKVWAEDIDEDEPSLVCEECSFSCRSLRAMNAHYKSHKRGSSRLPNLRPTNPNALM